MRKLVAQRERWQRVILETWWANRRMLLNPRYGTVGMLGMPFYLLSEIVAPLFEILAVVDARRRGGGRARRLVGVRRSHARDHVRQQRAHDRRAADAGPGGADVPRSRASLRFFALMPLELFVYRPFMGWARVKGTWRCLRGDKGWHKFERNVRTGAT